MISLKCGPQYRPSLNLEVFSQTAINYNRITKSNGRQIIRTKTLVLVSITEFLGISVNRNFMRYIVSFCFFGINTSKRCINVLHYVACIDFMNVICLQVSMHIIYKPLCFCIILAKVMLNMITN